VAGIVGQAGDEPAITGEPPEERIPASGSQ
jgi:hypothetical protein